MSATLFATEPRSVSTPMLGVLVSTHSTAQRFGVRVDNPSNDVVEVSFNNAPNNLETAIAVLETALAHLRKTAETLK